MSKVDHSHGLPVKFWDRAAPPPARTSAAAQRVNGPKAPPAKPNRQAPPVQDHGRERISTGTYNLAGGNSTFAPNFQQRTSDLVAEQMVKGVDVMSLQEVAVNTANAGPIDYNREIMHDIFAHTHGLDDQDVKAYYYDDGGRRRPINDAASEAAALRSDRWSYEGGGHSMTVDAESFDKNGNPQPFVPGGHGQHPITVYRAQLDNGQEYNSVFADSGSKSRDGQYGNAVLLGPGMNLRDSSGRVAPGSVRATELGTDPELWKAPEDREARTAVGVRFTTPEGQTATAVSAHLTTESLSDKRAQELREAGRSQEQVRQWTDQLPQQVQQERQRQLQALESFTFELGGERNLIVGGDFNQRDLSALGPGSGLLHEPRPVDELDHVLVSSETHVHHQRWVEGDDGRDHPWDYLPWIEPDRYSDHLMLLADITL